jgi:hypothetical protein
MRFYKAAILELMFRTKFAKITHVYEKFKGGITSMGCRRLRRASSRMALNGAVR